MHAAPILNHFEVDARLARLMRRADWAGKRTDPPWLARFPAHPDAAEPIRFVELCGVEHAMFENRQIRDPGLSILWGALDSDCPPGDFDPSAGYLIGLTDCVDSGIMVDLRPPSGARIIYENLGPIPSFATAFDSIDAFVAFYVERHGA